MLKHYVLWGTLFINIFAENHVFQQNISSTTEITSFNSSFIDQIVLALAECSLPIYTSIEDRYNTNSKSESSDQTYSDRQDEPILAVYKRSSNFDNYDSDDNVSNRHEPDSHSSYDLHSNNDDNNSDSGWSGTRSYSHGYRTSNSHSFDRNGHSNNKSRDNHTYDDSNRDRYYASGDSFRNNRHKSDDENSGHGSHHFGYNTDRDSRNGRRGSYNSTDKNDQVDDNDDDDSMNNYQKRDRSSNDSSKNSTRSFDLQHILRRKSRETYNTGVDGVSACTIQCILSRINVVNKEGFPTESALVSLLEVSVADSQLFNSSKLIVQECFIKLHSEMEEDNCEFSKKLADCLGLEFRKSNINATDQGMLKLQNQNNK